MAEGGDAPQHIQLKVGKTRIYCVFVLKMHRFEAKQTMTIGSICMYRMCLLDSQSI